LVRRLRAGEACSAETLLETYPDLQVDADLALELIYTEFITRDELGQQPSVDAWCRRFPQWHDRLDRLLRIDELMQHRGGDTEPSWDFTRTVGSHPPERISRLEDRYEVLGELGRGGMGVVYRARQAGLNRDVAVKMILSGEFADAEERSRFRREAEAAGRLQHPNIVQIHEVGAGSDRPYISMELVEGGSLEEKLAQNPLLPLHAARLAETLARATHYAHERGIIHRDLKPANVLLAADGTPKITDFGLAKHLADGGTSRTRTGAVLGTPSYMAPERALGQSQHTGPAVDIYALGALLYEALTGRPPFLGSSPLDTLEQVRTREPLPPRRLQPKIPGDLETICLKCLQKDARKRYASALDLAEDLRRYQAAEPIRACPIGPWERTLKWARRRPAAAALVVAVPLLTFAGIAGIGWQWWRAENKRHEAQTALEQMTIARQAEEAQRQRARRAVDKMFTQVAEKWLAQQPGLEPLQRQFLEEALRFYQEFAAEGSTDPELRWETGVAHRRVGEIQQKLGAFAEAEQALNRSIVVLNALVADSPSEPRYQAALGDSRLKLGGFHAKVGRPDKAEKEFQQSLTLREKLVAEHPDVAEHRKDLAVGLVNLAGAQEFESGFREAAANYTLALALLEKLPVDLRDSPECSFHQALCRQGLGLALTIEDRSPEAEEPARQALATLEKLVRDFPTEPTYRHRLAWNLWFVGAHCSPARSPEGEKLLRRAVAIAEKLAADFPTVPDYAQDVGFCRKALGLWLTESGRSREGEQTLAEASQVFKKLVAGFPGAYDYSCEQSNLNAALAQTLLASGRLQEAEEALRGSLTIMEKSAANLPGNPFFRHLTALTHHYLGEVLCEARRSPEAEREYCRGLSIWSELLAAHPDNAGHRTWLACAHNNLAELFTIAPDEQYRDAVRAVPLARKAVALHPQPGGCWNTLGITLYRAGDWNAAVNALEKSRELRQGGDWYDWFFLAMAHWRLGHKEEARRWYDQAIAWMEKNAGELARNKPKHAQFCRFRTEAAELLGVELQ
jgi:tetratricopeptide (TPR) repeat protein/predicted Ser/Thr protein kinase